MQKNVYSICVNKEKAKNEEYYVHNCLSTQNISGRIFKMLKVVTSKEKNWVLEGQRRDFLPVYNLNFLPSGCITYSN